MVIGLGVPQELLTIVDLLLNEFSAVLRRSGALQPQPSRDRDRNAVLCRYDARRPRPVYPFPACCSRHVLRSWGNIAPRRC